MTAPDAVPFDRPPEHLARVGIDLDGAVREPLGDGHSNPTYLIRAGQQEIVLRRPPLGELAPSTHDVLREARILRGLEGLARVPRVLYMCADVKSSVPPSISWALCRASRCLTRLPGGWKEETAGRAVAEEFIGALVDLHGIDWAAAGLADSAGRRLPGTPIATVQESVPSGGRRCPRLSGCIAHWPNDRMPASVGPTLVTATIGLAMCCLAPQNRCGWPLSSIGRWPRLGIR